MKTIQIRLSDEEHTAIKVAAANLGLSIKEFVLDGRVHSRAQPLKSAAKQVTVRVESSQPQEEPTMFASRKPLWKKSAKV